jgi:pimeloyl-ACP methyl ester carboxylesterase
MLVMQLALAQAIGPTAASIEALRKTLFSDDLPAAAVKRHLARGSVESLRVACELAWPDFPTRVWTSHDTPMLILGAEKDFFVSPTMVEATARVYGTRAQIIPNLAHAMMLEPRWQIVADRILHWLRDTLFHRMH